MAKVQVTVVVDYTEKVVDKIFFIELLVACMMENMLAHVESINRVIDGIF